MLLLATVTFADAAAACMDQARKGFPGEFIAPSVPDAIPSVVVLGSSTAAGEGPSTVENGFVWRLAELLRRRKPGECLTNLAAGGFSTLNTISAELPSSILDTSRNIDKALSLRPSLVVIHLPTNDPGNGIPFETSRANLLDMVHRADSAGSRVLLIGAQPRGLIDEQMDLLMQWKSFLDTQKVAEVVNVWDSIVQDSAHLLPELDNGDGIHLNDSGHAILFRAVVRSKTWQSIVPGGWDVADSQPVGAMENLSMPAQGSYTQGARLDFTAHFSRSVTMPNTAAIRLTIGGSTGFATYDSGNGTPHIRFRYVVKPNDLDADGILVARSIDPVEPSPTDSAGQAVATNIVVVDPSDTILIYADQAPRVILRFPDITAQEGFSGALLHKLGDHFDDSDGFVASFAVTGDSSVFRYALSHDTLRITSRPEVWGKDSVVVTALDNDGASVSDTFAVTVVRVNKPPLRTFARRDSSVARNFANPILLVLKDQFQDPDGMISGFKVDGDSSIYRYVLSQDTLRILSRSNTWGKDSLVVTAFDDSGAWVSDTFAIEVRYTTSILSTAKPPVPSHGGSTAEFSVVGAMVDQIPSSPHKELPLLGLGSQGVCGGQEGCSGLAVEFQTTGILWLSIFDNLGNPVIAGTWRIGPLEVNRIKTRSDGSRSDVLYWNQRDSRGESVPPGVYLWKVGFGSDAGVGTEKVFRLGIRAPIGR